MRRQYLLLIPVFLSAVLLLSMQPNAAAQGLEPTGTPTVSPDVFNLKTAIRMTSPDKAISLNLPAGWTFSPQTNPSGYAWFVGSDVNHSIAEILIVAGDTSSIYRELLGTNGKATGPKEALEQVLKTIRQSQGKESTAKFSDVVPVTFGGHAGYAFTFSDTDTTTGAGSSGEIGIATLTGKVVALIGYTAGKEVASQVKPVFETAMKSLEINANLIPTNTPTIPTVTAPRPTPTRQLPTPTPGPVTDFTFNYRGIPQSVGTDGAPVIGSPSARITLILFVDYACPHCREYQSTVHQIIDKYVRTGQVKLITYFMTFMDVQVSEQAARRAICAGQQGHFAQMSDTLLANTLTPENTAAVIDAAILSMDLDQTKFSDCLLQNDASKALDASSALAAKIHLMGVPTLVYALGDEPPRYFVNSDGSNKMPATLEDVEKLVKAAF